MLTRKRFVPPIPKDGGIEDVRVLGKAIADYLLSLELKASLTITEAQVDSSPVGSNSASSGAFTTLLASSGANVYKAATNGDVTTARQLRVGQDGNTLYSLYAGYYYTGSVFVGAIQVLDNGSAAALSLNPSGGSVGVGCIPGTLPRLDVVKSATNGDATTARQIRVGIDTNINYSFYAGYYFDGALFGGVLQALDNNVGSPIQINPAGGNVEFGAAVRSKSATAGVGYSTGAGGTVTQITSKATSVTLNKICGQISMHNAALAAGAKVTFFCNNSTVASGDGVHVWPTASVASTSSYRVNVTEVGSGFFYMTVENITAGSLSEALVLGFAVIKSVAA